MESPRTTTSTGSGTRPPPPTARPSAWAPTSARWPSATARTTSRPLGLPTERDAVGKLWEGDWQKYLDTGKKFMGDAPKGVKWVDSASGLYNAAISSSATRYYDEQGEVVYKTNPDVKEAWDVAAEAASEDMTDKHELFTDSWNKAMNNGTFATLSCPAWMLGYIQDKGGEKAKGKWDVAPAPKA
ncbi:hypothetical protein LUW77_11145 [Streptomyces radiopugnans]|nr:hypothetical protein LUW77_11145 [Streptomyces radiopugnans]